MPPTRSALAEAEFEVVARLRPIDLIAGSGVQPLGTATGARVAPGAVAPYVAVTGEPSPGAPLDLVLESGSDRLVARWDGSTIGLRVSAGGRTTEHVSRRHGTPTEPVSAIGLSLTGSRVAAFTGRDGRWTLRARYDLTDRLDTRSEPWLSALRAGHDGPAPTRSECGPFGQLGLRDLRVVSHADGAAYLHEGRVLLTATSAGPGFFDTAHTSIWALEPKRLVLTHLSDLFFRRAGTPGVYGDHATHLLRDGDRWLVATSSWGDFDRRRPGSSVGVNLASTTDDLLTGCHVLDTEPLALPTTGLRSVGVWDPHLVRGNDGWLVGFVSAPRFFSFHPVLAGGPALDRLTLLSADPRRRATEGTTLVRDGGRWLVAASDGRDGRREHGLGFPLFDLDLVERGRLRAAYPTNLPWPTLVPHGDGWLLIGFDGTRSTGSLAGYGTHGDVVIQRSRLEL